MITKSQPAPYQNVLSPDHPETIVECYRCNSDRRMPGRGMITGLMKRFPEGDVRCRHPWRVTSGRQSRGLRARGAWARL